MREEETAISNLKQTTMKSFYNTNNSTGQTLVKSEKKCKSQEMAILKHFQVTKQSFTVFEMSQAFPEFKESSVGRAMTNLKNEGKLRKTGAMKMGGYGSMVHIYQLRVEYKQTDMFS